MLRILHTERRGAGWAYAGLAILSSSCGTLVAALQRHAIATNPWQGRLYRLEAGCASLLWESDRTDPAQLALDALLEELAPFGLPDDLYPLVTALLPQGVAQSETAP